MAAIAVGTDGAVAECLEWRRDAFAQGEWWRALTGHLVHWTAGHLAWDLIAFVALGAAAEIRSRWGFGLTLLATVGLVEGALRWVSDFERYRGSSALATALAAYLLIAALTQARLGRRWLAYGGGVAVAVGLGVKLIWEAAAGTPIFSGSLGAGVSVAAVAHLAGAAAGAIPSCVLKRAG